MKSNTAQTQQEAQHQSQGGHHHQGHAQGGGPCPVCDPGASAIPFLFVLLLAAVLLGVERVVRKFRKGAPDPVSTDSK